MKSPIAEFKWIGDSMSFIDKIDISNINHLVLGRFGGNSSVGQDKNEDGCLIWVDEQKHWEFVILLDAHNSVESANLVIKQFSKRKIEIQNLLALHYEETLNRIKGIIIDVFQEDKFLSDCRKVRGETACLIVLRKDKYLWWFSIGDCISYLFHHELANLGQYQINQRQFYEWVGQVNTFEQAVPCYSSGIRELRKGLNRILLTTDGLVECPQEPFNYPKDIYNVMKDQHIQYGITALLQTIKDNHVRDNTTIISWDVNITENVTRPSDE
ncbi:protein phosphatase 2C domain-containing protein [Oceanobacillus kapialis]|uniref:Protein phosphatase 2C domain-containing protein n=1 Tax=Oceanobacillus kapialis TaxID=481353 RepID=A0ABW5Q1R8_9BACI